jgi:hypothetical protein
MSDFRTPNAAFFDPDTVWLDHVQPVGLVVAPSLLKELGLVPQQQTQRESAEMAEFLSDADDGPALPDAWAFFRRILGWEEKFVAGTPGGGEIPDDLYVSLTEYDTVLKPDWAVRHPGANAAGRQLLVQTVPPGVGPDRRNALSGWEATPHQRFERLLRETGVEAGVLLSDRELRLVYAPRGETSGWLCFPLQALKTVAGRPMLGGLKLILGRARLFTDAEARRLPALLRAGREAQAHVSTTLSEQVLGALHELLRGLTAAEPELIRALAADPTRQQHLYEGLLTVLLRLVFVLYAEDRDLIPSRSDATARNFYQQGYSVRGLYARLLEDAARNPDTMEERRGAWGRLIATFRLVHGGDGTGWIKGRGGKLFDPDAFPFLEGRADPGEAPRVALVSDGSVLRILHSLLTLKGERLSYRTLDVEQIGSVYETVMGFTAEVAQGPVLAIKAGKNNRTPVFVNLSALVAAKPADRVKRLKEDADRGGLSKSQEAAVKAAKSADEMAAALEPIADERASPQRRAAPAGTPILQPTDERRRTGSHYTPRSLTAPIVLHALEPAFARLGDDATPEQVLDLKVCDPAMGSGAFLVEACRALASRLVKAWARHPGARPVIPPDEDEELHARRLAAQRCLYGVDKNPLAVDLARLSLWLATLARDHEFTFLDHALKSGDSLVGLTRGQIAALHWDADHVGLPLFRALVNERFVAALQGRAEIRNAGDDVTRAVQEIRHRQVEERLNHARWIGDAVVAAFFSADKPKAREKTRVAIEMAAGGEATKMWATLDTVRDALAAGAHPIKPFHWELEFPEVFARDNPGFDAMVGNPPFAGKNTMAAGNRDHYPLWLQTLHTGAHGNADLAAHFFRRAFALLRSGGCFGLIATNTIAQGDTRQTGLTALLHGGGTITHATRRLKWPGEAAVVVSVIHLLKGRTAAPPLLDDRPVGRISAYLVDGDLDDAPARLAANAGKSFIGSYVLGMGFTFDDAAAAKGTASSLAEMERLITKDPRNAERIFPYIGGEEVNNDPRHAHRRYVIDFGDMPLRREDQPRGWSQLSADEQAKAKRDGVVPHDYPEPVAEDWPDLIDIVRRLVKPQRDQDGREARRKRWWRFGDRQPGLYSTIIGINNIIIINCGATPHMSFAKVNRHMIYAHSLDVIAINFEKAVSILQSRPHETWTRFFASTLEDRLRYTPSDCFETFPFPADHQSNQELESAGQAYHDHRAALMVARNEGLTKTYNRFHDPADNGPDIVRLRELHDAMDHAVLRAYGWDDLIPLAVPVHLDETNEDDHKYQGRYFWPADVRDAVLARLLALNAERAKQEKMLGVSPEKGVYGADEDDEDD